MEFLDIEKQFEILLKDNFFNDIKYAKKEDNSFILGYSFGFNQFLYHSKKSEHFDGMFIFSKDVNLENITFTGIPGLEGKQYSNLPFRDDEFYSFPEICSFVSEEFSKNKIRNIKNTFSEQHLDGLFSEKDALNQFVNVFCSKFNDINLKREEDYIFTDLNGKKFMIELKDNKCELFSNDSSVVIDIHDKFDGLELFFNLLCKEKIKKSFNTEKQSLLKNEIEFREGSNKISSRRINKPS